MYKGLLSSPITQKSQALFPDNGWMARQWSVHALTARDNVHTHTYARTHTHTHTTLVTTQTCFMHHISDMANLMNGLQPLLTSLQDLYITRCGALRAREKSVVVDSSPLATNFEWPVKWGGGYCVCLIIIKSWGEVDNRLWVFCGVALELSMHRYYYEFSEGGVIMAE